MAVDVRRGTRSRVACSTGHCDQRYACRDLHGDIGVSQGMHRSVWQPCRVTHLMHPCVHCAGIDLCAALRDEQSVCVFPPIAHVVVILILPPSIPYTDPSPHLTHPLSNFYTDTGTLLNKFSYLILHKYIKENLSVNFLQAAKKRLIQSMNRRYNYSFTKSISPGHQLPFSTFTSRKPP